MKLEDAVILRIEQLCLERKMTKYQLFKASGVPQSTLTSIKKSAAARQNSSPFIGFARDLTYR